MDKQVRVDEIKAQLISFRGLFEEYAKEISSDTRTHKRLDDLRTQLLLQEPKIKRYVLDILGNSSISIGSFGHTATLATGDLLATALLGGNNELPFNFRDFHAPVTAILNRAIGTIEAGLWPPKANKSAKPVIEEGEIKHPSSGLFSNMKPANGFADIIKTFLSAHWWQGIIGLATLIILILAVLQLNGSSKPPESSPSDQTPTVTQPEKTLPDQTEILKGYKNSPKPKEIIETIDKLPLLLQPKAEESYVGLKVAWECTIWSIRLIDITTANLMLNSESTYPWIYCDINVSTYPEIKTATRGIKVLVAGEISEVHANSNDIYLTNCLIEFK